MIKAIFIGGPLLLAASSLSAQSVVLPEVVAEASRNPVAARMEAPSAMVVVERDQVVRHQDRTIGDVLRRLPGISYSGPPGVTKDVRMRGMGKGYTQILINGERMASGKKERQMSVDRISADMIERIEIVRTPTANLDSQGVGGTINIILKEIPSEPWNQLRVSGGQTGDDSIAELGIQSGGRTEAGLGYLLNLNATRRFDNKADFKRKFKADGSLKETSTKDETSEVTELTLAPRLDWRVGVNRFRIDPFLIRTEEDKDKPEFKFKADGSDNGAKLEQEEKINQLARMRIGWERTLDDGAKFDWRVTFQRGSEDKDKKVRELKADGSLKKSTTEDALNEETEWSTEVSLLRPIGEAHLVTLGGEWYDRNSDAEKLLTENGAPKAGKNKDSFAIDETRLALYASDEWLLDDNHLLTPGLRVERYNTTPGQTAERSDTQVLPSVNYRYQWNTATAVRAGLARTLRLPRFDELNPFIDLKDGTLAKPDQGGNPDLIAERAWGLDIGIDYELAGGVIGVNLFQRRIDDLIEPVALTETGRVVSRPQNVGEGTLTGIELDASRRFGNLILWGNATALDSEVEQNDGITRPMKDVPDYIANLGLDQTLPDWGVKFGVAVNILGRIDSEAPKDGKTEIKTEGSKVLWDLYFTKALARDLELTLTVKNLSENDKFREQRFVNPDGSLDSSETRLETSERTWLLTLAGRF